MFVLVSLKVLLWNMLLVKINDGGKNENKRKKPKGKRTKKS